MHCARTSRRSRRQRPTRIEREACSAARLDPLSAPSVDSADETDDDVPGLPHPNDVAWDIRRAGRAWREEAHDRYQLTPDKFEMWQGKLFWTDQERLLLLGLLLENVGADAAVRLGDPKVWREAVSALDES